MPSPSLNRRSDRDRRFQQPFRYTGLDDYWWRYDPIHIVSPVPFLQMRDGRPSISGSTPAFGLPSTATGNAQYTANARLFGSEGTLLWSGTVQSGVFVQPLMQVGIDFSPDNYIAIQANSAWNGTAEFFVRTSAVTRFQVADNVSLTGGGNAILSGGPSGTFCCVNGSLRGSNGNTLWASGFSTTTNRVVSINYQNRGSGVTATYPWAIVAWFGRQIPQHEALELSRNPYLLFRPEASAKQTFYSLPAQGAPVFLPHFARHSNIVIGASINA